MLENTQKYISKCTVRTDVPIARVTAEEFPAAWEKTFYKEYLRFESIGLNNDKEATYLRRLIQKRKTTREYQSKPIAYKKLSNLIHWSLGEVSARDKIKHRAYPSAGGRYPIECYVGALNVDGLPRGLYHYSVKSNKLETLGTRRPGQILKSAFFGKFTSAPAFIILTGVFSRSEVKYGTKAMAYLYLEAGQISQNIALNSEDLGLASCTVCGYDSDVINGLLDLDTFDEISLCCFAIGEKKTNKRGGEKYE